MKNGVREDEMKGDLKVHFGAYSKDAERVRLYERNIVPLAHSNKNPVEDAVAEQGESNQRGPVQAQ